MARTKKEFNKEAMYKKIMPSMHRSNEENNENDSNFEEEVKVIIDDNIKTIIEDFEDKSIYIDEEKETFNNLSEDNACDTFYDNDKVTVNFFEMLVRDKLDNVLNKFKCCKCQSCKNDIVVISLNNLPVYNFSGNKLEIEEALREFKNSNNIDIVSEIIKSIISVRKKGKH